MCISVHLSPERSSLSLSSLALHLFSHHLHHRLMSESPCPLRSSSAPHPPSLISNAHPQTFSMFSSPIPQFLKKNFRSLKSQKSVLHQLVFEEHLHHPRVRVKRKNRKMSYQKLFSETSSSYPSSSSSSTESLPIRARPNKSRGNKRERREKRKRSTDPYSIQFID